MNQSYHVGQTYFPKQVTRPVTKPNVESKATNQTFNRIFEEQLKNHKSQELKFSTHAKQRLADRGIHLDSHSMNKLNHAVAKAAEKGVKDSLILMKDLAFVINVPNRVVITTVDEASMKEHIFTNIDGAIII